MGRGVENEEFVCNKQRRTALMYACIYFSLSVCLCRQFCAHVNDVAIIVNDSKINKNHVTYRFSRILN